MLIFTGILSPPTNKLPPEIKVTKKKKEQCKWIMPLAMQVSIPYAIYLYREIFTPFQFRPFRSPCLWENLKLRKLHWLKLSLFKNNLLWANSRQDETICK